MPRASFCLPMYTYTPSCLPPPPPLAVCLPTIAVCSQLSSACHLSTLPPCPSHSCAAPLSSPAAGLLLCASHCATHFLHASPLRTFDVADDIHTQLDFPNSFTTWPLVSCQPRLLLLSSPRPSHYTVIHQPYLLLACYLCTVTPPLLRFCCQVESPAFTQDLPLTRGVHVT
jgi:hypothetical protein